MLIDKMCRLIDVLNSSLFQIFQKNFFVRFLKLTCPFRVKALKTTIETGLCVLPHFIPSLYKYVICPQKQHILEAQSLFNVCHVLSSQSDKLRFLFLFFLKIFFISIIYVSLYHQGILIGHVFTFPCKDSVFQWYCTHKMTQMNTHTHAY